MANGKAEKLIGYLGPRGTHSEEIAYYLYKGEQVQFVPYVSIESAIRATDNGEVDECVVPVENSLEGSVNITLDTLVHEVDLFIIAEIAWGISNNLLVNPNNDTIDIIVSHGQPLAQCRQYLTTHYPQAQLLPVMSTADAAKIVASGAKHHAAIGSKRAAEIYNLNILAENIQDKDNNCTRFIVLRKQPLKNTTKNIKTSIVCQIKGENPGSLCDVLQEFAINNVNLTKIESRPAKTALGEYIFFLDIDGGINDDKVAAALQAIGPKSRWIKNLGSYPAKEI